MKLFWCLGYTKGKPIICILPMIVHMINELLPHTAQYYAVETIQHCLLFTPHYSLLLAL